jgi:hypothetical protein
LIAVVRLKEVRIVTTFGRLRPSLLPRTPGLGSPVEAAPGAALHRRGRRARSPARGFGVLVACVAKKQEKTGFRGY